MSRNLKLYITGVVAASVIALLAATILFPPETRIALTFAVGNIPGVTVASFLPILLHEDAVIARRGDTVFREHDHVCVFVRHDERGFVYLLFGSGRDAE